MVVYRYGRLTLARSAAVRDFGLPWDSTATSQNLHTGENGNYSDKRPVRMLDDMSNKTQALLCTYVAPLLFSDVYFEQGGKSC